MLYCFVQRFDATEPALRFASWGIVFYWFLIAPMPQNPHFDSPVGVLMCFVWFDSQDSRFDSPVGELCFVCFVLLRCPEIRARFASLVIHMFRLLGFRRIRALIRQLGHSYFLFALIPQDPRFDLPVGVLCNIGCVLL